MILPINMEESNHIIENKVYDYIKTIKKIPDDVIMTIIDTSERIGDGLTVPVPLPNVPIMGFINNKTNNMIFETWEMKGTFLLKNGEWEIFILIVDLFRYINNKYWTVEDIMYKQIKKPLYIYLEEIEKIAA